MNSAEELARQIARVAAIKSQMEHLPGGVGRLGAHLAGQSLELAYKAAGSNDPVEVIVAVKDLREFKG